jgi:hypothetical protein
VLAGLDPLFRSVPRLNTCLVHHQIMLVIEILYEMMFRALLLEDNVDSERGPILSEKQMRNTIGYRRQLKMMNMMHSHNRIPHRLPIGLEEQIKTFSSKDLRRFYDKWSDPATVVRLMAYRVSPTIHSHAPWRTGTILEI